MERIVNGYANALLAFAHTECTAEFDLIAKIILADETLELFDNST
jgi:hypothetical protein